MSFRLSRRDFLANLGFAAAATALPSIPAYAASGPLISPFRISVINDEIGEDFGHVCEGASKEFGMQWIERRGMWNKHIVDLEAKEVDEARRIRGEHKLGCTHIGSQLV